MSTAVQRRARLHGMSTSEIVEALRQYPDAQFNITDPVNRTNGAVYASRHHMMVELKKRFREKHVVTKEALKKDPMFVTLFKIEFGLDLT